MACYRPITAYYSKSINQDTGRRPLTFNAKYAEEPDNPIQIACGQCVGCRLEYSRQWAIRCLHEAQMHDDNSFITLTFSPEALEERENPLTVDIKDFQLFMRRLRKLHHGKKIRYYHCGEYGDDNGRPHYHACLFGHDFKDKQLWKIRDGIRLYISKQLSELWPYGFSTIGDVTFESAAYVARYVMKKRKGKEAPPKGEQEPVYDRETGELLGKRIPEYVSMSRRPGIGAEWYKKYGKDVRRDDYVIVNGQKIRPPKYYDGETEKENPYLLDQIKYDRATKALDHADNQTYDRLKVREIIQEKRAERLTRTNKL